MSRQKTRVSNTDRDNLVSNLRGEIGEIISSWVLMRNFRTQASHFQTDDISCDMKNSDLKTLYILIEKIEDDIIARLSELAEEKVGRLTFYFVQVKLCLLEREVCEFAKFIYSKKFHEKRNYNISHKQLPEKWTDHKHLHIPYRTIVKGIVLALRLMKKIDRIELGPSAPFLWREMRKRRYKLMTPPKVGYMLLPELRLSAKERFEIAVLEAMENRGQWVEMTATVDGASTKVWVSKKWGIVRLGNSIIPLPQYPIIEIKSIKTKINGTVQSSGEDVTKETKENESLASINN